MLHESNVRIVLLACRDGTRYMRLNSSSVLTRVVGHMHTGVCELLCPDPLHAMLCDILVTPEQVKKGPPGGERG